jgi:hypothetical protein
MRLALQAGETIAKVAEQVAFISFWAMRVLPQGVG